MNKPLRWILLPATLAAASFALVSFATARLARIARAERASHKESVREWENEGGALARAAGPTKTNT
jgi:hypothetical protein